MSRRPSSPSARSTSAPIASQSATEEASGRARPPAVSISATTASAEELPPAAAERLLTITLAPCWASAIACSRPSPVPAPVTIATLPSRSPIDLPSLPLLRRPHDALERRVEHRCGELASLGQRDPLVHPPHLCERRLFAQLAARD